MRVLVACEFSGAVREAFRAKGHDAWSCDLLPAEDGSPHHFQGDALGHLADGWDLMIAHPPCTHLTVSGARWFTKKRIDGRQQEGIDFFLTIAAAPVPRYCIENPVGIMSSVWRKPDQIIQPYYFGDEAQKTTCLWLKGLRPLAHLKEDDLFGQKTHVYRGHQVRFESGRTMSEWYFNNWGNAHELSRTFPGIAAAMADQWGAP